MAKHSSHGSGASEQYEDRDAQARFEAALKSALSTSPKPLKDKPKMKKAAKKAKKPSR
jgi:hypothetical protein